MQNRTFISNLKKGIRQWIRSLFTNPYQKTGLSWLRVKQLKHLPPGKLRKQSLFSKTLYFTNPSELLHGLKEIFIEELYKQYLPDKGYIIDCGANIGLSVIYMKKLYPNAKIVAFEPDELNFKLLGHNIQSFGYADVTLRKEAVWVNNTQLSFAASGSMSSRIDEKSSSQTKLVQAIRLRELLNEPVDFLKIDIEGAEYEVIKDCQYSLTNVKNLFVEYHGKYNEMYKLSTILNIMTEQGFAYYIKEAGNIYSRPFYDQENHHSYDVQLNIFCFRR